MAKLCFRKLPDRYLNLLPTAVITTNIFAVRSHGAQPFLHLDIIKHPLQPFGGFLTSGLIPPDDPQRYDQVSGCEQNSKGCLNERD